MEIKNKKDVLMVLKTKEIAFSPASKIKTILKYRDALMCLGFSVFVSLAIFSAILNLGEFVGVQNQVSLILVAQAITISFVAATGFFVRNDLKAFYKEIKNNNQ